MRNRRLPALLLAVILLAALLLSWVLVTTMGRPEVSSTGSAPSSGKERTPTPPSDDDAPDPLPDVAPRTGPTESLRTSRENAPRPVGGVVHPIRFVPPESHDERFPALFQSPIEPVPVELDSVVFDAGTPDGAVIKLASGFHEFSLYRFMTGKRFPTDVTIEGAGMDATILRLSENHISTRYLRLTFRDITLDLDGETLLSTHSGSAQGAAIRLDRCRVLNFGRPALIESEQSLTVFATDSRFEGGYGKSHSPEHFLYARRILARFERCFFLGDLGGIRAQYRPDVEFVSCTSLGFLEKEFTAERAGLADCVYRPCDAAEARSIRHDFLEAFTRETMDTRLVRRLIGEYRLDLGEITRRGTWFDLFVAPVKGTKLREIRFPAGIHQWDPRTEPGAATEGFVIRGAGRDDTLLELKGPLRRPDVTFRDLTLDLGRGHRMYGGKVPGRLRLMQCRVIGFDVGAGGSFAFTLKSCYLAGKDTEFLAGYGKSPGKSNLIRSGKMVLARLEDCLIRIVGGRIWRQDRYTWVCLDSCRLLDVNPNRRKEIERMAQRRLIPGTTVEYADAESAKEHGSPRPLSNLNPAWGKGRAR